MALSRNLKSKITATTLAVGLSVAGAFGAVAPATAQDASANENVQHAALQAPLQTITAAEAQELSRPQTQGGPGSVVLLVGDNFSQGILNVITEYLIEKQNYNVKVYHGGDRSGHLQLFAAGGALPDYFDEDTVVNLPGILGIIVQQNNLNVYAQNNSIPENDGPA